MNRDVLKSFVVPLAGIETVLSACLAHTVIEGAGPATVELR